MLLVSAWLWLCRRNLGAVWHYRLWTDNTQWPRTTNPIVSLDVYESRKTPCVRDCLNGGNESHLEYIRKKVDSWIDNVNNGHLSSPMGWIAYKFQLWPGVRYGIGTLTNDLEEAGEVLVKTDYRMLIILEIASTITRGWRWIYLTLSGFGLSVLPLRNP